MNDEGIRFDGVCLKLQFCFCFGEDKSLATILSRSFPATDLNYDWLCKRYALENDRILPAVEDISSSTKYKLLSLRILLLAACF